MNIIICGAGKFGYIVALGLLETGEYDITIIEQDQTITNKYNELYDLKCICGSASDVDILRKANINSADAIICLMSSNELNIVTCELAYHLFSVPVKIARLSYDFYEKYTPFIGQKIFGIDSIFVPEQDIVDMVTNSISTCGADEVFDLLDKQACFMKVLVKGFMPIVGIEPNRVYKLFPEVSFTIILIQKYNTSLVVTNSQQYIKTTIEVNDILYLICSHAHLGEIIKLFGSANTNITKVVIASSVQIGALLTKGLLDMNDNLSISFLCASENEAIAYNNYFPSIDIFLGDFSNTSVLQAANVANADLLLALSDDLNKNITAALLAKSLGCSQVFSLVCNKLHQKLKNFTSIDLLINPQSYLISKILNSLYDCFNYIYAISPKDHYVAELTIPQSLAGLTYSQLELQLNAIIIGCLHKDQLYFVFDDTFVFDLHDRVAIFASLKTLISINSKLVC